MTTTGLVVVRRTVRVSSSSSIESVYSETWIETIRRAWMRPSATVRLTGRWTVTGSVVAGVAGQLGAAPCSIVEIART
jgi:hypothetical protein